jgi:hypothetical protein
MEVYMSKRYGFISLVGVILLAIPLFAQGPDTLWTKTYGGKKVERGFSVCQTSDGGYIIAGKTYSYGAGGSDVYLVKTNSVGDTLWTKTCGGTADETGFSVCQTSDGGYIVAGSTYSYDAGADHVYLIKTNADGDTLWTKAYGGIRGRSVCQTTDGGYIVTGIKWSSSADRYDAFLVKTDSVGDTLWTKTYGGTDDEEGFSVCQTSDGGYIVTGHTKSFGAGGSDVYLVKTDSVGDTLWTKTYGGTEDEHGRSVCQTSDGGYIVSGNTNSFGAWLWDAYLVKTNANGDTLWTKTYGVIGGPSRDLGYSVCQTSDNGYIVTGSTMNWSIVGADVWLLKIDSNGDSLWTRTYGGTDADGGFSVCQTSDGGYIVAGYTMSVGAGSSDVWLLRLGPEDIRATVEFLPDTFDYRFNYRSHENLPCFIEIPALYWIEGIDESTIAITEIGDKKLRRPLYREGLVLHGDYNQNSIPDIRVRFNLQRLIEILEDLGYDNNVPVKLTVSGKLMRGRNFRGSDTVGGRRGPGLRGG